MSFAFLFYFLNYFSRKMLIHFTFAKRSPDDRKNARLAASNLIAACGKCLPGLRFLIENL